MSFPAPEQLPALTAALIRLRGDTLGRIAEATGIRAANLSVRLRGKEQVISAKRVVGLLHHLGVEGNRLRSDMLHQWRDGGALIDSKTGTDRFAGARASPGCCSRMISPVWRKHASCWLGTYLSAC